MPGFYLPDENEYDHKADDFIDKRLAKERKYKHFDLPLRSTSREISLDFTQEKGLHRFMPLLGYVDVTNKYSKNSDGEKVVSEKKRPIRFASHSDAAYLETYSDVLNGLYETKIAEDGISSSVLAYRKGGSTNIHHAKSLFDEIKQKQDCCVIAMDISGFFDCLDHQLLKKELCLLAERDRLSSHHWNVFNNITKFSWVETDELDILLGKKRNGHGRICSPNDFKDQVRGRTSGLIQTNEEVFGIPQGTPISGLYANIYMRTFDNEISKALKQCGGSYRRYSDDIAVVLPLGTKINHVVLIVEKLLADFQLSMSVKKTESAKFLGGKLITDTPIQYLGFVFDGNSINIRASSLDAYRAKMRRGIHAKLVAGKMQNIPSPNVYKREPLSRYTHLGKRRNFLNYAFRAADIMDAPEIRYQVKNHMTWFNRCWEHEVNKIYGGLVETF